MEERYSRIPEKTALLLSAGGMFGAYQAGAWKELSACFQPDMAAGTSVGALNGWAIAGGTSPEDLIRYWNSKAPGAFLQLRTPLYPWRGFFDNAAFLHHIEEFFFAFTPRIPFGAVLTDLLRLEPRLVCSEQVTWRHLAAACAIPVALPPVRVDGRLYVDGGLLNVLPLWAAAAMGATRAIAINALPLLPSRVVRAAVRSVRWFSRTAPVRGTLEVITIAPAAPLGTLVESVRWNRGKIQRWIEQGAEDARRVMPELARRDFGPRVLQ